MHKLFILVVVFVFSHSNAIAQKKVSYSVSVNLSSFGRYKKEVLENSRINFFGANNVIVGLGFRGAINRLGAAIEIGYDRTSFKTNLLNSGSGVGSYSSIMLGVNKHYAIVNLYKINIVHAIKIKAFKKLEIGLDAGFTVRYTNLSDKSLDSVDEPLFTIGPGPVPDPYARLRITANQKFVGNVVDQRYGKTTPLGLQTYLALVFKNKKQQSVELFWSRSITPAFVGTYSLVHPAGNAYGQFKAMIGTTGIVFRRTIRSL